MDIHLAGSLAASVLGFAWPVQVWTGSLIGLGIALTAFCSACEDSFLALDREVLKQRAKEGRSFADQLLKTVERPRAFLRRVVGTRNLLMLLTAALMLDLDSALFVDLSSGWRFVLTLLSLALLLFLLHALAGQWPRKLALQSQRFPLFAFPFYRVLTLVTAPLVLPGMVLADQLVRLAGVDPMEPERQLTEQELREFIDQGRLETDMETEDQELLENIFEFGDKTASEVMTHRMSVVAIGDDWSTEAILDLIQEEKFTRMPIYHEDVDHITGILNSRDFLLELAREVRPNLQILQRAPYYVPESMKVSPLFRAMQKGRHHMAVVIDEYGGTAGIVTMEDLMEQLVGQIQDEYDEELPEIEALTPNVYLVQGQAALADLGEVIGYDFPEDYDTVAGLVLDLLDRIPLEGEQPEVQYQGLTFQVMCMEDKRIDRLRLTLPEVFSQEDAE